MKYVEKEKEAMKILTIVGARPQFIKAAVVSRAIKRESCLYEVIVHTGQHYDKNMSDVFFDELDIPKPNYNLGIGGGSHGAMTGRQLEAIEDVLLQEKPEWVLVYGDTNSTLAGALAAAKLNIKVAHVEAGLRSFNRRMPEEINRVLTDHASSLLLAPTEAALKNLKEEGIASDRVRLVGDVMYDASLYYRLRATKPKALKEEGTLSGSFILATVHRAENTDSPEKLRNIILGLERATDQVILPLHPRTRARLDEFNISIPQNIKIIDPVGYLDMIWLEENCRIVATDSGGVQKEAYYFRKPCVTLREETEWIELVDAGWNILAGSNPSEIERAIRSRIVKDDYAYFYGNGSAGEKVVRALLD